MRDLLGDQTTDGKSSEMKCLNLHRIQEGDDVLRHLFDAIGAGRTIALTMAPQTRPHDPETGRQQIDLPVPDMQIGAQRMQEEQYGRICRPIDPDMEGERTNLEKHDAFLSQDRRRLRAVCYR